MARGRSREDGVVEIGLLGPLEARRGAAAVAVGGAKPGALLAVLALEAGRAVPVDLLVEALWPGTPPETAPHAVQVYVSQLRKALGAGTIVRRGAGYALELEPERVDTHRFVALAGEGRALLGDDSAAASTVLRDALGLWRGPALADFAYEPFAQTEIARLEELRLDAVEARIDADLALGRHADLVSELEALVQAHPLREHSRAQLMLALYRSGRQADALAVYRAARGTLVDELGIEPGPELRELEASILRQDESLQLPETTPAMPAMQFRRLVTILFVDVVESMALAAALDPEALGRVLRRYFETVSSAVVRHGGTVEKYAGDAVMAVFGIPVSHEDDALRAVRSAVDVRTGVAALSEQLRREHGVDLEVRIGIVAGEVLAMPTDSRQRFVAGEAVGLAARVEEAAGAGEIVVGEVVARLIDHAARLEPIGELEIKGRSAPFRIFRLLEIGTPAPAFEGRLEAPLAGRKRELAALRRALKRAVQRGSTQAALVVGSPGVGKSRLATELTRRAKEVTWLWGRCLSYGDGVTYWPLREVLEQAAESDARDAVLAALDAETPPPAAELAWAFRQFCETSARERSLMLVFDDLQWAEPTFLELVEHLVDKGDGPILVVCLARDELLDERPTFLERLDVERIELGALDTEEAGALLESLGGAALESDKRARVVETAEGNPLFLEQLLALALEGGLREGVLPPTVQVLLAARLDRLGPGERAVLERAAVVGKEFSAGDVVALLDPEAVPTADSHLLTLVARGFVRPSGDGAFAFRHVLVQEAAYRAAPKRLRAELHERFAARLDETYRDLPDLDEFVGYHLEQAHRLRTELGESDRRVKQLAEDGGRRLGKAGMRAFKRGDMYAASNLLERSTQVLPGDDRDGGALLCDLGLSLHALQETERAIGLLEGVLAEPHYPASAGTRARVEIELEFIRVRREPGRTADGLLAAIDSALPVFGHTGDNRALGRAYLLQGWVEGGRRGNHMAWAAAAEQALARYRAAGWPVALCLGQIANALYWGPTPALAGIARIETLLEEFAPDRQGTANLQTFLGGLLAQVGKPEHGRTLIGSARGVLEELGLIAQVRTYPLTVMGEIELLVGNAADAEVILRELCEAHEWSGELSHLASRASDLASALLMQDRVEEAAEWVERARRHAAFDDVQAQMMWRPVDAIVSAKRGAVAAAERVAREGVKLAGSTDDLNRRANAYMALGFVLEATGRVQEARAACHHAIALYEQKGNLVAATRARETSLMVVSA